MVFVLTAVPIELKTLPKIEQVLKNVLYQEVKKLENFSWWCMYYNPILVMLLNKVQTGRPTISVSPK